MILDSLWSDFSKVVLRVIYGEPPPPFWTLVLATVVKFDVSAGKVDVAFKDLTNRLETKTNVRVLASVGETAEWEPGTEILVGWRNGDERWPFALPTWWSGGGLKSSHRLASDSLSFRVGIPLNSRGLDVDGSKIKFVLDGSPTAAIGRVGDEVKVTVPKDTFITSVDFGSSKVTKNDELQLVGAITKGSSVSESA